MNSHFSPLQSFGQTSPRPASLRRFAALAPLGASDEDLVRRLKPKTLDPGSQLSSAETEGPGWILLSGWAARIRNLPGGKKQILHFVLPGDAVGISGPAWAGGRMPVVAITPVIAADAEPLRTALRLGLVQHAGLAEACARIPWFEQVYCLDAMVRLGQQTAYERLSHLLLETYMRLETVELASLGSFQLPVTQDVIADALGLSLVHLSRTLRQMRREGTIQIKGRHIRLARPEALAKAANFPYAMTLIK